MLCYKAKTYKEKETFLLIFKVIFKVRDYELNPL